MKKIGELKGKPIIEGNPNEIKNNQIHYKEFEGNINLSERKNGSLETISGSSSGSSSKYAPRYFSIDFNVADEGWKYLLSFKDSNNPIYQDNILGSIGATYKFNYPATFITSYPFSPNVIEDASKTETLFSYIPLYIDSIKASEFGMKGGFLTFEDIMINMPILLKQGFGVDVTLSMNGITEITEEEFYKID